MNAGQQKPGLAADAGLIVALATNGTLIDDAVARKIKESGIRRVSVSFDGADAATHDIFRGKGANDLAIKGMGYLREVGVPLCEYTDHGHCGLLDEMGQFSTTKRWIFQPERPSPTPRQARTPSRPAV